MPSAVARARRFRPKQNRTLFVSIETNKVQTVRSARPTIRQLKLGELSLIARSQSLDDLVEFSRHLEPRCVPVITLANGLSVGTDRREISQWQYLVTTMVERESERSRISPPPERMRAKLQQLKEELRRRMHRPVPETGQWLRRVVQGYYGS